jgi:hypothetical protein
MNFDGRGQGGQRGNGRGAGGIRGQQRSDTVTAATPCISTTFEEYMDTPCLAHFDANDNIPTVTASSSMISRQVQKPDTSVSERTNHVAKVKNKKKRPKKPRISVAWMNITPRRIQNPMLGLYPRTLLTKRVPVFSTLSLEPQQQKQRVPLYTLSTLPFPKFRNMFAG